MEKFKFYYEPNGEFDIKSLTISIEQEEEGYKVKVLKEIFEEGEIKKIKIKKVYSEIDEIVKKIESIDFEKKRKEKGENPLVVKYGEKKIEVNSLEGIEDICDMFRIRELLADHIENIKDLKEFLSK